MKKEKLIAAAKEMNELLGLSPKIKTDAKAKEKDLIKKLLEAADELVEDDKEDVSEETAATLKEIGATLAWEEEEAEEAEEAEEVDEEDEEDEDEAEEEDEEEDEDAAEEEEEEEEEAPQSKKKGKTAKAEKPAKAEKADKPKGKKPEKASGKSGKGVIQVIADTISAATKKKPVTKADILAVLVKEFPDRSEASMKNTINVQVPARMSKEKFAIAKTADGKGFYKA